MSSDYVKCKARTTRSSTRTANWLSSEIPRRLRRGSFIAEEEPEHPDYPTAPELRQRFGPRGVLRCFATDRDDPTEDARFGRMGRQRCDDTGPLTTQRMETVDEKFLTGTLDFIDRANRDKKPFLAWFNPS